MLDAAHASLDAIDDPLGDVDVGHHPLLYRPGLVDRGRYFLHGELGRVKRVGGRGGSPAGHDLELVGAGAELLPRRLPYLGNAVADGRYRGQPVARPGSAPVVPLAHVAVAAGLGDVGLAGEYARPRNESGLNGHLEAVIAATGVPDGGEPGHQRFPENAGHGVGRRSPRGGCPQSWRRRNCRRRRRGCERRSGRA